jgi:diguanylate cyclase (GGDEF)-like protein
MVFLSIFALVGSLWLWAHQADLDSRTHEERLIAHALTHLRAAHAQKIPSELPATATETDKLAQRLGLTRQQIDALSEHYLLNDLRLTRTSDILEYNRARMAMKDAGGAVVANLSWQAQRPGKNMFANLLAPMLIISLSLGIISLYLLRRSERTARSLMVSEAKAKHMALHDSLTGLPNRSLFTDRLIQARERTKRHGGQLSVLCVGIDKFKDVNDTLGHSAGDELIAYYAQKMSLMVRSNDTLARLGGDEFVIIQSEACGLSSAALAKRLLDALSGTVTLESGQVFTSCSIGITLLPDGDFEPPEALRQADLALYRAKETGRSQYAFFEAEMDATIKLRKLLEQGLREAVEAGNIDVVYQPQVDHFNQLTGVEALARWTHPERGAISPGYFIPLAEECGLMGALGELVMKRALLDSKRWPGLKVAINVSAAQMKASDFVERVKILMLEAEVDPSTIEIEITESLLLNDDHRSAIVLRELRQMGFTIALDDFGTGYSSLGYLNRYPVDKIKIDRSFVSNLGIDPEAEALVRAIIKLAKALNLSVLAEGVETKPQRMTLKAAGCSIIQGFIFSKPVPREGIDQMMRMQDSGVVTIKSGQAQAMMK